MAWITTKDGRHVNTDWFDEDERKKYRQIEAAQKEANDRNSTFQPSKGQLDYERSIRGSKTEKGAYFDKDGNILMEGEGDEEQITFGGMEDDWDRHIQFNREIEQRIWRDEEVHFTHNHPENTIFSPEDVETFETLEAKSESAVLADGTTYRLIRIQPRTSNEWVMDEKSGELVRRFEPKKIAPEYDKVYSELYVPEYKKIREKFRYGTPERRQAEAELDERVRKKMEKWLINNAGKFGYRFERSW